MPTPRSIRSVIDEGLDDLCRLLRPGGHPPMVDLMQDPDLGEVLRHFHDKSKPTAFYATARSPYGGNAEGRSFRQRWWMAIWRRPKHAAGLAICRLSHDHLLELDVTNEAQAKAAADVAIERFGRDRRAASIMPASASWARSKKQRRAEVEKALPDQCVSPPHRDPCGAPPHAGRGASGRILNISSIGGYRGSPALASTVRPSSPSKACREALHGELAPLGIHVTVIEPGFFRTDFLDASSLFGERGARSPTMPKRPRAAVEHRAGANLNHAQPGNPGSWPT